jgi:hypothetical protein
MSHLYLSRLSFQDEHDIEAKLWVRDKEGYFLIESSKYADFLP